jgi:hypothetical protein
MPGNTFVQPVAGEPSGGTPHLHYANILNTDPAGSAWASIDLSAQVPVGTNAIFVYCAIQSATSGRELYLSNATGGTVYARMAVSGANNRTWAGFMVPISSDRKLWWWVDNADVSLAYISMTMYFI